MTSEELREEIHIELESIESTVKELVALDKDLRGKEPSVREKAAAGAFLAQLYSGIENILKRVSQYQSVPLPVGDTWHIELFKRFCDPPRTPLPALFDESLAQALAPFRKFRHVVLHGYGFQLDWDRMKEGVESAESVFVLFRARVEQYLGRLEHTG